MFSGSCVIRQTSFDEYGWWIISLMITNASQTVSNLRIWESRSSRRRALLQLKVWLIILHRQNQTRPMLIKPKMKD